MKSRVSHEIDDPSFHPPRTRIAIPQDFFNFNIIEVSDDAFDSFCAHSLDILSGILSDNDVDAPLLALREVIDNLVHAVPCTASVVIDPSFRTVVISDTGPGISRPDLAFELGYTTADDLKRSIIRGVGLGLHIAREDARSRGGDLKLDSVPGEGTYARVFVHGTTPSPGCDAVEKDVGLSQRQNNVLFLLSEGESLGPSGVASELNIGVSTAHRDLVHLQKTGLVHMTSNGKRFLSEAGRTYLQGLLSL